MQRLGYWAQEALALSCPVRTILVGMAGRMVVEYVFLQGPGVTGQGEMASH